MAEPKSMKPGKANQIAARHGRLIASARRIAEGEGWPAVTVRRLAEEIGYSQPVIYSHFPDGRAGVVTAVALVGFAELAAATHATGARKDRLGAAAQVYLDFARANPGVYEAMFSAPTDLPFADPEAPLELRDAFSALQDAVTSSLGPDRSGARTEVVWSMLHGLSELERGGRIPRRSAKARLDALRQLFGS